MKLKIDFITNSSSASFYIMHEHLSVLQLDLIKNHLEVARAIEKTAEEKPYYSEWNDYDRWDIIDEADRVYGSCLMDNFDMRWFLRQIGVEEDHLHYDHHG